MEDPGQQVEQEQQDGQGEPGWIAAGSPEDQYEAQLGEVLGRYPELADEQRAARAVATAAHIANQYGEPTLAGHPMTLEIAHVMNEQQAAEERAAEAAQPVDPAQQIIDAGPRGRKVLPF